MHSAIERSFALSCVAAALALASPASAQSASDLTGTWSLVTSVTEKDGTKTEQFGNGAKGMLHLDPGGRFMLTIIGAGLPAFSSGNRATGTPQENSAVVAKSIAMLGTYSVDAPTKALTFHVDSATFPNWDGTTQKRLIVTADGNELKYVTPTASNGGIGIVTWKRAD